jgi:hypothetical protein
MRYTTNTEAEDCIEDLLSMTLEDFVTPHYSDGPCSVGGTTSTSRANSQGTDDRNITPSEPLTQQNGASVSPVILSSGHPSLSPVDQAVIPSMDTAPEGDKEDMTTTAPQNIFSPPIFTPPPMFPYPHPAMYPMMFPYPYGPWGMPMPPMVMMSPPRHMVPPISDIAITESSSEIEQQPPISLASEGHLLPTEPVTTPVCTTPTPPIQTTPIVSSTDILATTTNTSAAITTITTADSTSVTTSTTATSTTVVPSSERQGSVTGDETKPHKQYTKNRNSYHYYRPRYNGGSRYGSYHGNYNNNSKGKKTSSKTSTNHKQQ